MKKLISLHLLITIIAIVIVCSLESCNTTQAQTTPNIITTRPAQPKSVLHRIFSTSNYNQPDIEINNYISYCVSSGYIIKSITATGSNGFYYWLIIAEKY